MVIGVNVSADRSDVSDAVEQGVREGMGDAAQAGFAESQAQVAVASGDLKQSGALIRGENSVAFGYRKEYARYVEEGTDPHWPPIEPLKEWASIVLGDESAAWAVQAKIAQEGTDPQPFMQPAFEATVRELQRRGITSNIEGEL